ncbi:hypothetical protein Sango_1912900 [Sesamum angolense]|uniref:Uncharacterized protein n=1 Tax=Sesamum angolense TaxID=2727404 RepID=A0AAE1WJD6_9LAMI|nr:hypothetical protein Sango_1912900 [Sesamum angolense]
MASKNDQVVMNEKNNVNTDSQSPTGGKIVDTNHLNESNSASSIEISSKSTPLTIIPAMITDATAMKEQLAQMAQAITNLQKIVEDKYFKIAQLMSNQEHTNVEEPNDNHKHISFSNHVENEKQRWSQTPSKSTTTEQPKARLCIKAIYQTHQRLEDANELSATGTTGIKPGNFEELATRAHNMELSIAAE